VLHFAAISKWSEILPALALNNRHNNTTVVLKRLIGSIILVLARFAEARLPVIVVVAFCDGKKVGTFFVFWFHGPRGKLDICFSLICRQKNQTRLISPAEKDRTSELQSQQIQNITRVMSH